MSKLMPKLFLLLTMTSSIFVGCGGGEEVAEVPAKNSSPINSDGNTIRLYNGKIEIDAALKAYAQLYTEQTGVNVIIESIGGGADVNGTLKGYLAADNMPDMFVFDGSGYETWKDQFADLSDQAWVTDTDVAYVTPDGKVVGFPYAIEGYGLTYNKDLLDKAGIDPATLTSYNAYADAFAKLNGMKEELGIDAVVSMAASVAGGMTWSTGNHNFGTYLATGLDPYDTSIIDGIHNGVTPDRARLDQYAKFVKLLFDYSDEYVLISGSYDDQLALWIDQKAVFIHQGNWIDPNLINEGLTFEVGIAPSAFLEKETDGILAGAPSWWGVYKDSDHLQETKDFLNSLALTEEGETALVLDAGMISPFKSTTVLPTAPLAKNVQEWVVAGKTYPWHWSSMPDGFGMNTIGPLYELLATDAIDATLFADMVESAVAENAQK
ncbi:hypothetical protein AN639_04470 [Candidatus Epulonipiscium fishelsonii]|uniref:Uncharacterized protein n=1 Tax=Candidatus Epulonipiscium fishelsonii TaxID=77094 RepID=A0ACC8X8T1_9FIRM|nr:hypothetical protein AN396_11160 [Epulopiscium sp. SCG-B11WGA-EpuloA1]ONI40548.1 hypothetical protein AN639_04470 [Epulopiscium sp. SCG-B05WGA-EpuloA1]